jgi:hypothetical protein
MGSCSLHDINSGVVCHVMHVCIVVVSAAVSAAVSGLDHTTYYQFMLRAVNVCGPGPSSKPSSPIRTLGQPSGTHLHAFPFLLPSSPPQLAYLSLALNLIHKHFSFSLAFCIFIFPSRL